MKKIHYLGGGFHTVDRKLVLHDIDYDRHPFFHLVGLAKTVFISPAVAGALRDAGLRRPRGTIVIGDMWLDTTIAYAPPDGGRINVPLRIFGTNIVAPDSWSEPFRDSSILPIR